MKVGVDATDARPYKYNNLFVLGRNRRALETGKLSYPDFDYNQDINKIHAGPCYHHNSVVYGNSKNNLQLALRRFWLARDDEDIFRMNQCVFFRDNAHLDSVRKTLTTRISVLAVKLADQYDEIGEYAHMPHAKRMLRVRALQEIHDRGSTHQVRQYMRKRVVRGMIKIPEFAKPGKVPRLIGDFSVAGSLVGAPLYSEFKQAFCEPLDIGGIHSTFIPMPTIAKLTSVFDDLLTPGRDVCYYFSDDMCIALDCQDGRLTCNVDISSCDASNGTPVFMLNKDVCSQAYGYSECISHVIEQCTYPIEFREPKTNRRIITLQPRGHFQYSGSVATTFNNNLASCAIISGIAELFKPEMTREVARDCIIDGARMAGYKVTCEVCERPEDLQFLKHSPCLTEDGSMTAILNLGVILRSIGQADDCRKFIKGDIALNMERHNSGVVRGYKWSGEHELLHALRRRFNLPVSPKFVNYNVMESYLYNKLSSSRPACSLHSVCARYRITEADFSELCVATLHAQPGDCIHLIASQRILEKDYGCAY
jgi:hypothetical protein